MTRPTSPFALNYYGRPFTSSQSFRWRKQGVRITPLGTLMRHVEITDTCWLWTGGKNRAGYGKVKMSVGGQPKRDWQAHRAMFALFFGDPGDRWVLHYCDNPPCVNPDHLFLGNHQDNMDDMAQKGRRRGNIRLTPDEVRAIRSSTGSAAKVGASYGIGRSQVGRIRSREAWPDA